ncbi:MAG: hypothetical protein R6X12_10340, partial [bacterium]
VNYSDEVSVLSYDGSQLLTTLPVQDAPFELAYSPRSRRLYVSHLNSRQVYVIRDEAGGIAEEPPGAGWPVRVRATVTAGRLRVEAAGLLLDVSGRAVAPPRECGLWQSARWVPIGAGGPDSCPRCKGGNTMHRHNQYTNAPPL